MAIDIGRAKVHQSSGKSTLIFTVVVNLFHSFLFQISSYIFDVYRGNVKGAGKPFKVYALPFSVSAAHCWSYRKIQRTSQSSWMKGM